MEQLSVNANSMPDYSFNNKAIRYNERLVIGDSEELKGKILHALHESPIGGHSGIQNTYRKVQQVFFWPQLKKYVWDYVMCAEGVNTRSWLI